MDLWLDDLMFSDRGIVISEIMPNPAAVSDSYGEWFEITNTTDSIISIQGWVIKDNGVDMDTIQVDNQDGIIEPGQYFVLARNGNFSSNGGISANYDYDGFSLSNNEDQIIIMDSEGAIVDEVHYTDDWNFSSGVSMEIHDTNSDNSLMENWFISTSAYGSGDFGTPGSSYEGNLNTENNNLNPEKFIVYNLFPNPFNSSTTIGLFTEKSQIISIQIFDMSGREIHTIKNKFIPEGNSQFQWGGNEYSTGIYFIKISSQSTYYLKKAVLVK